MLKITLLHIRTNRTNVKKEKSPKNRAFPGADSHNASNENQ